MAWAQDELQKIAASDDLHVAPFREDGVTCGTPTRWFRAALRQKAGRITAAGLTKEVALEPVEGAINDAIDEAYRAKHRGSSCLNSMISARARTATVRIIPADEEF